MEEKKLNIKIGDKIKYFIEQIDEDNNTLPPIVKTGYVSKICKCVATDRYFYYVDKTASSSSVVYEDNILNLL